MKNYNLKDIVRCYTNLDMYFINRYKHQYEMKYNLLVTKHRITIQDIFNNHEDQWIAYWWLNPNTTAEDLIQNNITLPKAWELVSYSTPLHTVILNQTYPWNFKALSSHKNITPDFINNNLSKNWNWKELSSNPIMTIPFIIQHRDKIIYEYLSDNLLTFDYTIYNKYIKNSVNNHSYIIQIVSQFITNYV
jgi:hypothetical protein